MTFDDADELPHRSEAAIDEWLFAAWSVDAATGQLAGCVSGHRLVGDHAWYWSAVVRQGEPLLQLTEWNVTLRRDLFVVKAPEMWAEHHCVDPMQQWSIGNEGYFVALDDPDEALRRAYGTPTPVSFDLEWYATHAPEDLSTEPLSAEPTPTLVPSGYVQHGYVQHGYVQHGVVHGQVELLEAPLMWAEVPAVRWHRWTNEPTLGPVRLPPVVAHTGLRAPFLFPDGAMSDWVLTPAGFRSRATAVHPRPVTSR